MEPMWYCHECHAEMRPLMQPDPRCASCRGTFVEKMDDPSDDPREFEQGPDELDGMPPAIGMFLNALQSLTQSGQPSPPRATRSPNPSERSRLQFSFSSSTGTTPRTIHITRGTPPTMSDFARRGPEGGDGIAGNLMAQYLMAMLGGGLDRNGPMPDLFAQLGDPAQQGRMGDYVFNQEALDQIISQLMENSNAHRPVPAPEEMIQKLPREVLEEGSPMLQKDCAVCKDQFSLDTEDPDEQVVVSLPCNHPFHVGCIEPWLKSSGTCPVCRHALVPQPTHDGSGSAHPPNPDGSGASGSSNPGPGTNGGSGSQVPSLFANLFGGGSGSSSGGDNASSRSSDSPNMPGGFR